MHLERTLIHFSDNVSLVEYFQFEGFRFNIVTNSKSRVDLSSSNLSLFGEELSLLIQMQKGFANVS